MKHVAVYDECLLKHKHGNGMSKFIIRTIHPTKLNLQLSTQALSTHSAHYHSAHSRRAGLKYMQCHLRQMWCGA